jgi:WhiB family transcriptional regulator, redox-sensing transcriptional regulator
MSDNPTFFADAACASADPDLFFPDRGVDTIYATAVCGTCPVRAECLEFAIVNDITYGVWGGVGERPRREMRMEYKRSLLDSAV